MKTHRKQKSGGALVAVVLFTALLAALAAGLLSESGSHLRLAHRQVALDQALYVAEGGMERAISHLIAGGTAPVTLSGTIGQGRYETLIRLADASGQASGTNPPGSHTISGSLNINPNNSPDNEFFIIKPDGSVITRDDLKNDRNTYAGTPCIYYEGPVTFIHVKPKGNGNQNGLIVDGSAYTLENSTTYEFESTGMYVRVYNDARNASGKPMGHWWLGDFSGSGISLNGDGSGGGAQAMTMYSVVSKGAVGDAARVIYIDGLHQQSWAKYALWYNCDPGQLVLAAGQKFYGPVHANTKLYFEADPEFFSTCSSTADSYGGSTNDCSFHQGLTLNAPSNSLLSLNFSNLQTQADLLLEGNTHIRLGSSNMAIINTRAGWNTWTTNPLPTNGLLYVKDSTTGGASTRKGNVYISGTLDGRLTVASAFDIHVTNHVRYAAHPTNTPPSDDALGLLAMRNVVIASSCPDNLDLYAHIIASGKTTPTSASDGSFWVTNYQSGGVRGNLTVYGGIVQDKRGPVGTIYSSGALKTGYNKQYIYDTRFSDSPPPFYPTLTNEYTWKAWREQAQ
jgi:hypothetical protein